MAGAQGSFLSELIQDASPKACSHRERRLSAFKSASIYFGIISICVTGVDDTPQLRPPPLALQCVLGPSGRGPQPIIPRISCHTCTGPKRSCFPVLQDTLCTQGLATTAGSLVLEGYQPPFDATCVARLKAAGASVLGKANCDQFAMGSTTESSGFKVGPYLSWLHSVPICS